MTGEPAEDAMQRLLRLCTVADLRGVEEGTSYGKPALKVGGKGFTGYRDEAVIPFRIPMEQKELLLQAAPEIYFETDHYKGWPWVLVRLDVISDDELRQRLVDAWRFRAPKKLLAAWYEDGR